MFCDYSELVTFVQNKWTKLSLAWHEWFSCKGKEWKIYCCGLALPSETPKWNFHVVVWQTNSKNIFPVQPIKSLILGVVVAVAVFLNSLLIEVGKTKVWLTSGYDVVEIVNEASSLLSERIMAKCARAGRLLGCVLAAVFVIRELKQATFLSHGRKPKVNISRARTVVPSRLSKLPSLWLILNNMNSVVWRQVN